MCLEWIVVIRIICYVVPFFVVAFGTIGFGAHQTYETSGPGPFCSCSNALQMIWSNTLRAKCVGAILMAQPAIIIALFWLLLGTLAFLGIRHFTLWSHFSEQTNARMPLNEKKKTMVRQVSCTTLTQTDANYGICKITIP